MSSTSDSTGSSGDASIEELAEKLSVLDVDGRIGSSVQDLFTTLSKHVGTDDVAGTGTINPLNNLGKLDSLSTVFADIMVEFEFVLTKEESVWLQNLMQPQNPDSDSEFAPNLDISSDGSVEMSLGSSSEDQAGRMELFPNLGVGTLTASVPFAVAIAESFDLHNLVLAQNVTMNEERIDGVH